MERGAQGELRAAQGRPRRAQEPPGGPVVNPKPKKTKNTNKHTRTNKKKHVPVTEKATKPWFLCFFCHGVVFCWFFHVCFLIFGVFLVLA